MPKKLLLILLLIPVFAFPQFNSPYYHKVIGDTMYFKKANDTLFNIRVKPPDTLIINKDTLVVAGGTGTVTAIHKGYGMTFSSNPITTSGTIGADTSKLATQWDINHITSYWSQTSDYVTPTSAWGIVIPSGKYLSLGNGKIKQQSGSTIFTDSAYSSYFTVGTYSKVILNSDSGMIKFQLKGGTHGGPPPPTLNNNLIFGRLPYKGDANLYSTSAITLGTYRNPFDSAYITNIFPAVEPAIASGTTSQYYRGDKSWQTFPSIPNQYWFQNSQYIIPLDSTKTFHLRAKIYPQMKFDFIGGYDPFWFGEDTLSNYVLGTQSSILTSRGLGNMAIGDYTLANNTGNINYGIGNSVLNSNTTGQQNLVIGASAMQANTTGSSNTAIGHYALINHINGNDMVAIGINAMKGDKHGSYSVAIGDEPLWNCQTVYQTVAIGEDAFYNSTSSYRNTGVGAGVNNLNNGATFGNVFLGWSAGYNESRNNRLAIGDTSTKSLIEGDFKNDSILLNGRVKIKYTDIGNTSKRILERDSITGLVYEYPFPSGTSYSAGYGLGLSGTTFYNNRYWGTQDSLKTSLSGLILSTSGKLTAITDNHSNWDNGYTYRLTSATGTAPLTLSLGSNALTGSVDTTTAKTGLANLYQNGLKLSKSDSTHYTTIYQNGLKANKSTTLTINGTAYDLSSNRSWTIPNYWQRNSTTLSPTTAQDNLQVYSNQFISADFENTHAGSDPAKALYAKISGINAAPNYAIYADASNGTLGNYSFFGNSGMFWQNDSSYFGNYLRLNPISAPSPTTDKLYNVAHALYWNGNALSTTTGTVTNITIGNGLTSTQSPLTTTGTLSVNYGTTHTTVAYGDSSEQTRLRQQKVLKDTSTWNGKVSFPGFGTSHTTVGYGDTTEQNRLRLGKVLKDTTTWNNKLSSITGTNLDNIWSINGILTRTGTATYSYVANNSSNWNTAYGWGNVLADTGVVKQLASWYDVHHNFAPLSSPSFTGTVTGTFSGNITGNVTGNTSGSSGSCTGNSVTATTATNIGGGTNGAVPYQTGAGTTGMVAATATANQVLLSGANTTPAWSTPTYPAASGTSGKVLKADGTNIVYSTETYAAPGTAGNIFQSDGTNWTSKTNIVTIAAGVIDSLRQVTTGFNKVWCGAVDYAYTIDTIYFIGYGAAISLTVKVIYGTDASAAGTLVVTAGTAVTSVSTATKISTFNNASVPATNMIGIYTSAITTKGAAVSVIIKGHRTS